MIRLSILYPYKEDSHFDFDYYVNVHMPLSIQLHGEALKGISVEKGLNTGMEGVQYVYVAAAHFLFDSIESFLGAFMPHAQTLQNDIANYTNIQPVIQFNEVMIFR